MSKEELLNIESDFENIEEDTVTGRYLSFLMEKELYGLEIRYITEIIGIQPVTVVPEMPAYVKGITNLRGRIIPVLDARLYFRKEEKEYDDRTCIIVIEDEQFAIGLIVDSVAEVLTISSEDTTDAADVNKAAQKYIKGMGKIGENIILLLDCKRLLTNEEG